MFEHVNIRFHLALWQVHGESDFTLDGERFVLHADHAVWVPSGVRHGFTTRTNSAMLPVFIPVDHLAMIVRRPGVIPVDHDLRLLFAAHLEASHTIIRPNVDIDRQILALVEGSVVVDRDPPLPTSAAAVAVAEALRFNPGDSRSVEELAASAHASVRTIERAFRAEAGMTLRQWRIHNRMEAAGALLRSSTSIDAVAHRVGYTSTSAFRRVFKQHFGVPPGVFVARYRDASDRP